MSKLKPYYLIILIGLLITGCSTTSVNRESFEQFQGPSAAIEINRKSRFNNMGIKATVKINGIDAAHIKNNKSDKFTVPAGITTISVYDSTFMSNNNLFTIRFDAQKDFTYKFILDTDCMETCMADNLGGGLISVWAANKQKEQRIETEKFVDAKNAGIVEIISGLGNFVIYLDEVISPSSGNSTYVNPVKENTIKSDNSSPKKKKVLSDSEEYCSGLGFTPGSEKYADCVIKIMDVR